MCCLPPHTTHLTQPLDKGCFGPLKRHWREECWQYITASPGHLITRYQFSQLFARAWFKGMTMHNIIEGFRVTGVYPFDRHVVVPRKLERASLAERTGLKFIPLCSPSRKQPDNTSAMVPRFSPEEIARFQVRFEEGYDLPDERYWQWVRMYHPESPPLREHDSSSPPADPESPTSQSHPIPFSDDETAPYHTQLFFLVFCLREFLRSSIQVQYTNPPVEFLPALKTCSGWKRSEKKRRLQLRKSREEKRKGNKSD